ncbi:Nucleolar Complex 2 protein [Ascosphaera pollenicola]|nr:Nucleolar Complex 2 protein [Ascosphaera pollenicola]
MACCLVLRSNAHSLRSAGNAACNGRQLTHTLRQAQARTLRTVQQLKPIRQGELVEHVRGSASPSPSPSPSPGVPRTELHPPPQPQLSRLEKLKAEPKLPFSSFLTDTFNREHTYLRISVTERCNLRCMYCMPEEGVQLSPSQHLLTTPEIVYLASLFVSQGVTKIRLTGGEPTVRKDFVSLVQQIGHLRKYGLKEICITSNGITLGRKLQALADAGLTGVNLSLDTLDPAMYQVMTRRKGFEKVMGTINTILDMNRSGSANIKLKINCVVMKGVNDQEIIPFVNLTREQDVEVRFIEYMPFDGNRWDQGKMVSYQTMLDTIRSQYPTFQKLNDHKNDTSKTYHVEGFKGKVGFITSMTHNFCGTCNRLRITSDGNIKVCLFGNEEVSLRDIIRKYNNGRPVDEDALVALDLLEESQHAKIARLQSANGDQELSCLDKREQELLDVIGVAVKGKKARHAGMTELKDMRNRPMILIGENGKIPSTSPLRTSTWSSKTVPTHLLTHGIGQHQSIRLYSTNAKPTNSQTPSSPTESTRDPQNHHALPHLTPSDTVHMVSIGHKSETTRLATARCRVTFSNPTAANLLRENDGKLAKGDVFGVARVAGIMAVKKTADLIPLAHPGLGISGIEVNVSLDETSRGTKDEFGCVLIETTVSCHAKTGVEMEAMTGALGAALTVYDMCKAVDKGMSIEEARVIRKVGGKSGSWRWEEGKKIEE